MRGKIATLCLLLGLWCGSAWSGTVYVWTNAGANGIWANNANWSPNTGFPGTGDTAQITSPTSPNPSIITLNANATCSVLEFNTTNNAGIIGNGVFTLTIESAINDLTAANPAVTWNHEIGSPTTSPAPLGVPLVLGSTITVSIPTDTTNGFGRVRITNQITGAFGITKTGNGQLQFTNVGAASNYSGTTTVSGGILWVTTSPVGNSGTGSGAVTINGGTVDVGASGMISGAITLSSGVLRGDGRTNGTITISGGQMQGPRTVAGSVTMASGSISPRGDNGIDGTTPITFVSPADLTVNGGTMRFDLNNTANNIDRIVGVRNVAINAGILTVVGFAPATAGLYTIISNTGTKTVTFTTINGVAYPASVVVNNRLCTPDNTSPTTMVLRFQTRVQDVTSSTFNATYGVGTVIDVRVTFFDIVTVSGAGTKTIALATGVPASTPVNYTSGSGSTVLVFNYTVAAGNASPDLDYVATNSLAVAGGATIQAGALDAILTLAAPAAAGSLGANKALVINTTTGVVTDVNSSTPDGNYATGSTVDVTITFNRNVNVVGTPQLTLETGVTDGVATYVSGSGSSILRFTYVVGAGHSATDLNYVATNSLTGTINDTGGNPMSLTLPALAGVGSLATNRNITLNRVVLTSLTPAVGPVAGGTQVTLSGNFFATNATVSFGGTAATNVSVLGNSTIVCTAPAHAAGLVDVVVANPGGGSATLTGAFFYNTPPSTPSAPTATPNPANLNQPITFTLAATDPEGDTITKTWIYGDGASDNTGVHTYTVAGVYTVRVDVRDGVNVVSKTIEISVGVTGGSGGPTPGLTMTITAMQLGAKAGGGHDSARLTASLEGVPPFIEVGGKILLVNIGGATKSVTLDERGKATDGSLRLKGKFVMNQSTRKREFNGGALAIQTKLVGTLASNWVDEGMDLNVTDLKSGTFTVTATLDIYTFSASATGVIATKAGKSGKFTYRR